MKSLFTLSIIGLLGFFLLTNDLNFFKSDSLKSHGHIISIQGTVMGRSKNDDFFKNLKSNSPLSSPHKIITGFNSQSSIHFGETFELFANSSIRLFKKANQYQIHVLSGEVKRLESHKNVQFLIDDKVIKGLSIKGNRQAQLANLDAAEFKSGKLTPLSGKDKKMQTILRDTFKLHQRFIEKCFIKHYERAEGRTNGGQIMLGFSIKKKGKLKGIKIKDSDFNDDLFHDCLIEVVSRVRLKFYEGDTKLVEFPIRVSLPN